MGMFNPPYDPAIIVKNEERMVPFQADQLTKENIIDFVDEQFNMKLKEEILAKNEELRQHNEDLKPQSIFIDEEDL